MNSAIFIHIFRFLALLLVQVFILNEIELHGFINPYIYLLFILLLPFEIPHWILMIIAFFTGISVDLFSNTLGMHAAAAVFMALFRPLAININRPRNGYEPGAQPRMNSMGFRWFLGYTIILVPIHHLFYFFVEIFNFSQFPHTFLKIIISSVISLVLILIWEAFSLRGSK